MPFIMIDCRCGKLPFDLIDRNCDEVLGTRARAPLARGSPRWKRTGTGTRTTNVSQSPRVTSSMQGYPCMLCETVTGELGQKRESLSLASEVWRSARLRSLSHYSVSLGRAVAPRPFFTHAPGVRVMPFIDFRYQTLCTNSPFPRGGMIDIGGG